MVEDRDLRVGEGPEVVGEAIELGQVERPACHAGDVAAGRTIGTAMVTIGTCESRPRITSGHRGRGGSARRR